MDPSVELKLLSAPLLHLSDRDLIDLFEFASENNWQQRSCFKYPNDNEVPETLLTAGMNPSETEPFLLALTRVVARFNANAEIQRRTNRRKISRETRLELGTVCRT